MINLPKHVLDRRVWNAKSYGKVCAGTLTAVTNMGLLDKTKNVIDVGAAAGLLSTYFAKNSNHVYCYEPSPSYPQTQKIAEQFNNVTTYNFAVSDFKGTAEFFIDDRRLSQNGFLNPGWGKPVQVKTIKLDDQGHENIGFIKIDTEGTELDVLHGAEELIKQDKPAFMIEIWDQHKKYPLNNIFEYMEELGYKCYWYWFKNKQIIECQTVSKAVADAQLEDYPHDADFIFVHNSKSVSDYTTCLISPVTP